MFKTLAVILAVVLLLTIFYADIKGWLVEHQMDLVISSLEVSEDTQLRLHGIAERVGRGFAERAFSDVEIETLLELRAELRALRSDDAGSQATETAAKSLVGKFEAILRRHKL